MSAERSDQRAMRIGFESHNYGAARNTYAPIDGVEHVKVRRVPFELARSRYTLALSRVFAPLGSTRQADLVHLWNRVSTGSRPWAVSFESHLPYMERSRFPKMHAWQIRRLLDQSCRLILPISDYALRVFRTGLTEAEWARAESRTHRVYPHQSPAASRPVLEAPSDGPLRLLFVGATFFGKGGEAVLRAMDRVADELDLQLTVVSPVAGGDYGGTPPADVDIDDIHRRLESSPRVEWHERLPNEVVLHLMSRSHLGLLPTFADTFGYVVLEFMSLGIPTVVSNVQALPEFTGPDTSWRVDVPVDDSGIWVGRRPGTDARRVAYHEAVGSAADQLVGILRQVRDRPELLEERSIGSTERLATQFDPDRRSATLSSLYAGALS